jgi:RNA polymerase sigma-70 factor, ECF subfamily
MPPPDDENNGLCFDDLFKKYFKPLCAYCQYKFGFQIDETKDIVHSVFIKLLESGLNFSSELSAKAFLYKVTRNICIDRSRHEKITQRHQLFVQKNLSKADVEEYNVAELKELQNNIEKAIRGLPEQMRQVFELSRYKGLKYSEIASQLGISIKTVETQMSRALVKLRQELAPYLGIYWLFLEIYSCYNK